MVFIVQPFTLKGALTEKLSELLKENLLVLPIVLIDIIVEYRSFTADDEQDACIDMLNKTLRLLLRPIFECSENFGTSLEDWQKFETALDNTLDLTLDYNAGCCPFSEEALVKYHSDMISEKQKFSGTRVWMNVAHLRWEQPTTTKKQLLQRTRLKNYSILLYEIGPDPWVYVRASEPSVRRYDDEAWIFIYPFSELTPTELDSMRQEFKQRIGPATLHFRVTQLHGRDPFGIKALGLVETICRKWKTYVGVPSMKAVEQIMERLPAFPLDFRTMYQKMNATFASMFGRQ